MREGTVANRPTNRPTNRPSSDASRNKRFMNCSRFIWTTFLAENLDDNRFTQGKERAANGNGKGRGRGRATAGHR